MKRGGEDRSRVCTASPYLLGCSTANSALLEGLGRNNPAHPARRASCRMQPPNWKGWVYNSVTCLLAIGAGCKTTAAATRVFVFPGKIILTTLLPSPSSLVLSNPLPPTTGHMGVLPRVQNWLVMPPAWPSPAW